MKKTETFIVFRNKKTGDFLSKYKSKEQTLAYSAEYTEGLKRAAKNEVEATKIQIEDLTDKTEDSKSESFKKFIAMLANGLEDD